MSRTATTHKSRWAWYNILARRMMTTANTRPNRMLLSVRIWSLHLTFATALLYWRVFTRPDVSPLMPFLALLGVIYLLDLRRLRSLGRTFGVTLLFGHLCAPIVYFVDKSSSAITLVLTVIAIPIGIAGLIFFNRPAVKALFGNQKSTPRSQGSLH